MSTWNGKTTPKNKKIVLLLQRDDFFYDLKCIIRGILPKRSDLNAENQAIVVAL